MPSAIAPGHECLILDACCIINIAATSRMEEVIQSFGMPVAVSAYVQEVELLTLARPDPADPVEDSIDLQSLVQSGLIRIVDIENLNEETTFLNLMGDPHRLDDGEAITGAIALQRNWAVATDDRRGAAVLPRQSSVLRILSTPELLHHWSIESGLDAGELRDALQQVQVRARYRPARRHPLAQWWVDHS